MLARGATYVAQETPIFNPLERIRQLAELRFKMHSVPGYVPCDYRDGVLVLRGCLPTR
jgi:hypothetical protein